MNIADKCRCTFTHQCWPKGEKLSDLDRLNLPQERNITKKEQKLFKIILLDIKSQYLPCNILENFKCAITHAVSRTLVQGKVRKPAENLTLHQRLPQEARAEPGHVPNGAKPPIQREREADDESLFRASTSRPGTRVVNRNSGSHGT